MKQLSQTNSSPTANKYLLIREVAPKATSRSQSYVLPILRETPKLYITNESFPFGIVGLSAHERMFQMVRWSKENMHRQGDDRYFLLNVFMISEVIGDEELAKLRRCIILH